MNLDKSSLEYLKYIYRLKECTFRELCEQFGIVGIENVVYPAALLISFIHSGYIAVYNPNGDLIYSYNLSNLLLSGTSPIKPDSRIIILPEGAYRVEQLKYKANALWIPITISLFSILITVIGFLLR